jgi:hypothetical protein
LRGGVKASPLELSSTIHRKGQLMADRVYPSGSTLSTPGQEMHNAQRVAARLCSLDDVHEDDVPFAAVIATITSPAQASAEHPRGRWQSGVPLCQTCSDRLQAGLPFGYFMIDAVLPKLCEGCGLLAPCTDCDHQSQL